MLVTICYIKLVYAYFIYILRITKRFIFTSTFKFSRFDEVDVYSGV